jgi:cell division protein FtsI/penicillin-binding protein 2
VVAILLLTLLGRVYWLQTKERDRILDRAQRQTHTVERLVARRGSIFDSTGQLLAGSIQTQTLFVDPKEIIEAYDTKAGGQSKLETDLAALGRLIEKDAFVLLQQIGVCSRLALKEALLFVEEQRRGQRFRPNLEALQKPATPAPKKSKRTGRANVN